MNACPAATALALRSCLSPRIGRSRAFSLPWSHSIPLLAVGAVPCRRQQFLQHGRVDRRLIGGDLDGPDSGRADGLIEEPTGGLGVPARGDKHVDDLAELVDRAVHIAPPGGDLHIGLVHLPAVADGVAAGRRQPAAG